MSVAIIAVEDGRAYELLGVSSFGCECSQPDIMSMSMGMGMREYGRGGEDGEDGVEDDGERGESWRPQRTLYN